VLLGPYFFVMWFVAFFIGYKLLRAVDAEVIAAGFTAASDDFGLAIAAASAIFGISLSQAFAGSSHAD
jgi:ACR3 family arsenite efflux pump ArsB